MRTLDGFSVPTQPRRCIAEPIAEIIFWVFGIIWMSSPQVEVGDQAVEPVLCAFSLKPLGSVDPCAHAAIAFGKFLKVNTFLERHELSVC